jgi:hypothetical protein
LLLNLPAQLPFSQASGAPHVVLVAVHGQPTKFLVQKAWPLVTFNWPAQPFLSQLWLAPHVVLEAVQLHLS